MERDFLGIGGQNPGTLMKKESRGSFMDSDISIGSATPMQLSNKASALQQFVSIQPIASVDSHKGNQKPCGFQAPEKSLGVERHGVIQFAAQAYQNQGTHAYQTSTRQLNDARFATVPHSSVPIAMNSHFFKLQGSSNGPNLTATAVTQQHLGSVVANNNPPVQTGVGALATRNVQKPPGKREHLTVFYAGSVNVYEDVSCDMAKAIMLMAIKECKPAAHAEHQRPEVSALSFSKGMISDALSVTSQTRSNTASDHVVHQCSGLSRIVSIASHAESGSGSALTNGKVAAKSKSAQISTSKDESTRTDSISLGAATANNMLPKAVPQARKASLARFLEKRKERVSNTMPYSSEKKPKKTPMCSTMVLH